MLEDLEIVKSVDIFVKIVEKKVMEYNFVLNIFVNRKVDVQVSYCVVLNSLFMEYVYYG